MSAKFYIKNENGNILSTDGKTKYTLLEGETAYDFLKTEDGKHRCFYVYFDENGNKIGIEISAEMVTACYEQREQIRYRAKVKDAFNITFISANMPEKIVGEDDIEMIETFVDDKADVEDSVLHNIDLQTLREALKMLTPKEYDLIYQLFLAENTLTERQYASLKKTAPMTIHHRKIAILKKLKKFF